MAKIILVSVLVMIGATLFGYAGGAVMATEVGRFALASSMILLVAIAIFETLRTIAGTRHI